MEASTLADLLSTPVKQLGLRVQSLPDTAVCCPARWCDMYTPRAKVSRGYT